MGTRIAALSFVGTEATFVYNTRKVDPNDETRTVLSQARREYKGENTSAAVRAFAMKIIGEKAEHCVAVEAAPGLYSIELPSPDDAAPAKPAKK